MRAALILLPIAVTACSIPDAHAPSLAHRPAEDIDPRIPVPDPSLPATPDPALVAKLDALVSEAVAGDRDFVDAAAEAGRLANSAGPAESESWILAQQALSKAEAARAPVTRAAAEVDSMSDRSVASLGGIGAANLKAIQEASARLAEIDGREVATIMAIQDRLKR